MAGRPAGQRSRNADELYGKDGRQYVVVTIPNPSWRYPRDGNDTPIDGEGGWVIAYALPKAAQ